MNEKINQQNFIDLLAEKHGMNKTEAELFVKEFFTLIKEALEEDKVVKIKGLGTFKLVDVETRESINVNTGERFQLPGHTKVSFIPDNSLRDVINKPFAHFETVILNENTVFEDIPLEENEEENDAIIEETSSQSSQEEKKQEDVATPVVPKEASSHTPTPQECIIKEDNPIVEHKPSVDEIIAQQIQETSTIMSPITKEQRQQPHQTKPEKEEKSSLSYLIAIIIIVILLCGGSLLFIYYPDLFDSAENTIHPTQTETPVEKEQFADTIVNRDTIPTTALPIQEESVIEVEEPKPIAKSNPFTPDSANYRITGTKVSYTIQEGETLTKVSLRFYGTKTLWPYIVKHNPETIKNPDNVPFGTTIKIPELVKK